MKRITLAAAVVLLLLPAVFAHAPDPGATVTDDVADLLTSDTLVNADVVEMRFKLTLGSSPLDGEVMLGIPAGWPVPQNDNPAAGNYTEVVGAYGNSGTVTSTMLSNDSVTARISGGAPGDIFYIKYGSGATLRVPYAVGVYDFLLAVNRTGTFEEVTNSPISVTVEPGNWTRTLALLPGETHAPGTLDGIDGTPDNITAGETVTVTFIAVDLAYNVVPVNSSGEYAVIVSNRFAYPPFGFAGMLDFVNGTGTANVTFNVADGNYVSLANSTGVEVANRTLNVLPGAADKLLTLLPGQYCVPGDPLNGRGGTPNRWIAGAPMPVEVLATDAYWNLRPDYGGPFHAEFTDTSGSSLSVDGEMSNGTGAFTVVLPLVDNYTLNCSSTLGCDVNEVPRTINGTLSPVTQNVTGETDRVVGPFTVSLTDEYGNPFEGVPVEFSLEPAAPGQFLLENGTLTGQDGTASAYVRTGGDLGSFDVLASCGSVQGSPAIMTLDIIDLTPPRAWLLTENGTSGTELLMEYNSSDEGGGAVSVVTLYYTTGEVWFPLAENVGADVASGAFTLNWTYGPGDVRFSVLATDNSGNVQENRTGEALITIDALGPRVTFSTLPAYVTPGTVNLTLSFDEAAEETAPLLIDGSEASVFDISWNGTNRAEISFDASGLTEGPHTLSLPVVDGYGNAAEALAGTFVVDAAAPAGDIFVDEALLPLGIGPFSFSWSFLDNVGVESVLITVEGGVVSPEAPRDSGTAVTDVDGSHGEVRLRAVVRDAAGNTLEVERVCPVDAVPPESGLVDWSYDPGADVWRVTAAGKDESGVSRIVMSYRSGDGDWASIEMHPVGGGLFAAESRLCGPATHDIRIICYDGAHPPNSATTEVRIAPSEEDSVVHHSPPPRFVPGKNITLSVSVGFDAEGGVLHYRTEGGPWRAAPLAGGPKTWSATVRPDEFAALEYYFVLTGNSTEIVLPTDGGRYNLDPGIPSSLLFTSPGQENPLGNGGMEIFFPCAMDRVSVEGNLTLSSPARCSWSVYPGGDVLVVTFDGPGEHYVGIGSEARSAGGYVLDGDVGFRTVVPADSSGGDAPGDPGPLFVVGAVMLLLLAAASLVMFGNGKD